MARKFSKLLFDGDKDEILELVRKNGSEYIIFHYVRDDRYIDLTDGKVYIGSDGLNIDYKTKTLHIHTKTSLVGCEDIRNAFYDKKTNNVFVKKVSFVADDKTGTMTLGVKDIVLLDFTQGIRLINCDLVDAERILEAKNIEEAPDYDELAEKINLLRNKNPKVKHFVSMFNYIDINNYWEFIDNYHILLEKCYERCGLRDVIGEIMPQFLPFLADDYIGNDIYQSAIDAFRQCNSDAKCGIQPYFELMSDAGKSAFLRAFEEKRIFARMFTHLDRFSENSEQARCLKEHPEFFAEFCDYFTTTQNEAIFTMFVLAVQKLEKYNLNMTIEDLKLIKFIAFSNNHKIELQKLSDILSGLSSNERRRESIMSFADMIVAERDAANAARTN